MKIASVQQLARCFVAYPISVDRRGLLAADGPYAKLPLGASAAQLREALQAALNESWVGPPRRGHRHDGGKGLLRLAGVKSWSKFKPLASCVVEQADDGMTKFAPFRADDKPGLTSVRGINLRLPKGATAEEMEETLLRALRISRGPQQRQQAASRKQKSQKRLR